MSKMAQTGIRLDPALLERLDRIAEEMSQRAAGAGIARSEAARAALLRGVEALELELGLSKKGGKPPRKAK